MSEPYADVEAAVSIGGDPETVTVPEKGIIGVEVIGDAAAADFALTFRNHSEGELNRVHGGIEGYFDGADDYGFLIEGFELAPDTDLGRSWPTASGFWTIVELGDLPFDRIRIFLTARRGASVEIRAAAI